MTAQEIDALPLPGYIKSNLKNGCPKCGGEFKIEHIQGGIFGCCPKCEISSLQLTRSQDEPSPLFTVDLVLKILIAAILLGAGIMVYLTHM